MICYKCGVRESTGEFFALCDECFDAFEAGVAAGKVDKGTAVGAFIPPAGYVTMQVRTPSGVRTVLTEQGP